MPIQAYYSGKGREVMAAMVKQYGPTVGKRVFYATAAKHGDKPAVAPKKKARRKKRHYSA